MKDNGIAGPTNCPSRHKFQNDFIRYGKELIEDQKQEKHGPLMINYDCKECDYLQKDNTTPKHLNTVSVVSQPNNGHDAFLGHKMVKKIKPAKPPKKKPPKKEKAEREDGHSGIEVGTAVWETIEPFISPEKKTLAQGTGTF